MKITCIRCWPVAQKLAAHKSWLHVQGGPQLLDYFLHALHTIFSLLTPLEMPGVNVYVHMHVASRKAARQI